MITQVRWSAKQKERLQERLNEEKDKNPDTCSTIDYLKNEDLRMKEVYDSTKEDF